MLKYILSIFFSIFFAFYSFAQKGTIQGTVKDVSTGETLIGANVLYDKGQGTVTDIDGNFSLELDYGDYTLKVSYTGFEPVEKQVKLQKKVVYVNFNLKTVILDED